MATLPAHPRPAVGHLAPALVRSAAARGHDDMRPERLTRPDGELFPSMITQCSSPEN